MDPIERLTGLFERFPGIGPRQATRFVHYLLRSSPAVRRDMIGALQELGGSVRQCSSCMRFHAGAAAVCGICSHTDRDLSQLAIVAGDSDLQALERSGSYRGRYFVLGGTIHLASEKADHLRIAPLFDSLPDRIAGGLNEVILAFPANPEGDTTAARVQEEISERFPQLRVTMLGRGLSTGSELEYADPETIKDAFAGRREPRML